MSPIGPYDIALIGLVCTIGGAVAAAFLVLWWFDL